MANKEEKQINPWDLLRADVKMYQADCLLSIGFDTQCQQCTKNVFASIINMINKYAKQAGSGAPERKTGKWHRITKRPMTEEEVENYCELYDCGTDEFEHVIYENLPNDGDNVLICTRHGTIHDDTFSEERYGFYFEEYGDLEDVVAWMPLPDPYREVDE